MAYAEAIASIASEPIRDAWQDTGRASFATWRMRSWDQWQDGKSIAHAARQPTAAFASHLALTASVAVPTFLGDLLRADAVVSGAYYYP